MTATDSQTVKKALQDAGLEIYRARPTEVQIAERVRLHIMDSGVRVHLGDAVRVAFTARSQRSDYPNVSSEDLFEKVRAHVRATAGDRGYAELTAKVIEVKDPIDAAKILDVWHEVTFGKDVADVLEIIDEVRWALTIEKYVAG